MKRLVFWPYAPFFGIAVAVTFLFRKAFAMHFFQDDYWFLKISRITSVSEFINFFSPFRSYSYKPLASETFYLLLHFFRENVFIGHLVIFGFFLVGLYYLYKIFELLTNNHLLSWLAVFLYAIHFTHVFQLYWFATFQEVALFTFLSASTYYFLQKRFVLGYVAFLASLLCKETAALFPLILLLIRFVDSKKRITWTTIGGTFLLSGLFYFIYRYSLIQVTALDNYKMRLSGKLIFNNMVWYLLWGIGFPYILPLYLPTLLGLPIQDFWQLFGHPEFKLYFVGLIAYLLIFGGMVAILWKRVWKVMLLCGVGFFITLGPILLFPHRWMVRLTLPVIFWSFFQGFVWIQIFKTYSWGKYVASGLIGVYVFFNIFGVAFHESSGLLDSENDIYLKTKAYFLTHYNEILQHSIIYFADDPGKESLTAINSQRLKNSYHDQNFLDHFFPGISLTAEYDYRTTATPSGAYVINTNEILQ